MKGRKEERNADTKCIIPAEFQQADSLVIQIICEYSNPSVYEQSVYEFSLIRDAQINTCFSIYEPIFAHTSSFLSQTDRCSRREVMGN
jgi:hypothetical protein